MADHKLIMNTWMKMETIHIWLKHLQSITNHFPQRNIMTEEVIASLVNEVKCVLDIIGKDFTIDFETRLYFPAFIMENKGLMVCTTFNLPQL